jgi:hypothetical protein
MLREQIRKWFREAVQLDIEIDPELKRKLLAEDHVNINKFLDNLCAQFEKAEEMCRRKGLVLKQKTMQDTVYDLTKYFALGVQGEAKRRYESDLEKAAREAEAAKVKEFEDVLQGKATGEFAEAGVISNEKIDAEREAELERQDRARIQSQ